LQGNLASFDTDFHSLQILQPVSFNIGRYRPNGDGSAFNDRPLLGNIHAKLNTAGSDGSYLRATQGAFDDVSLANFAESKLVPVIPDQVHWPIALGDAEITPVEIGRNSYSNPDYDLECCSRKGHSRPVDPFGKRSVRDSGRGSRRGQPQRCTFGRKDSPGR
jgi:hypothetical protein